jgi:hypothetical protein
VRCLHWIQSQRQLCRHQSSKQGKLDAIGGSTDLLLVPHRSFCPSVCCCETHRSTH